MLGLKFNTARRVLLSLALLMLLAASVLVYQRASATPPTGGITATPLASAKLPEAIKVKFKEMGSGFGKANSVSNILITKYSAPSGSSFGWHQHSGPIWVVITQGTLTYYRVEGTKCVGQAYPAGSAFLDPGNDTHTARNEGTQTVELYAVYMLPAGGPARIDMPDPGVCKF